MRVYRPSQDRANVTVSFELPLPAVKIARALSDVLQLVPASRMPFLRQSAIVPSVRSNRSVLTSVPVSSGSIQELITLCIIIASCLIYRNVNVSINDVPKVLNRCRQDRFMPLFPALVGFGIARYLYFGSVARSISDLRGDCFVFEDAFGMEHRIPLFRVDRFDRLRSFLEFQYRDSLVHPLMKVGRYNLTLGFRGGRTLRIEDWDKVPLIRPDDRVVMSIDLTLTSSFCTKCQKRPGTCSAISNTLVFSTLGILR